MVGLHLNLTLFRYINLPLNYIFNPICVTKKKINKTPRQHGVKEMDVKACQTLQQ